jgi:signal transduction histidine kinase
MPAGRAEGRFRDLPAVSMDRNQMDQVLLNVMKNAVEAIERNGLIEIVASRGASYVALSVFDSGIGLSEEIKARLFTPFYTSKRAKGSASRS